MNVKTYLRLVELDLLMDEISKTAEEKGWHDKDVPFTELIALIVSELGEAVQAEREPMLVLDKHLPQYEASLVELADVIIRIFDWCKRYDLPLAAAIIDKIEYNKTRPHRHGGKKF